MKEHEELMKKLELINGMERGEAARAVAEVLKYIMKFIRAEQHKKNSKS